MNSIEIEELRTTIEKDLAWRNEEISFYSSLLNHISGRSNDETNKLASIYRKNLVLALYAHFEGFFRFAFETYAYALNESKIGAEKAIEVLCASSLNKEFMNYENSNNWIVTDDEFSKAHKKIANRVSLIENISKGKLNHLELPISNFRDKSSIVNTESNLSPDVIDRILYSLGIHQKLGLSGNEFSKLMGLIGAFVKKRNGIAHGDNKNEYKNGVSASEYETFKKSYDSITNLIGPIITKSLSEKLYLKPEYR